MPFQWSTTKVLATLTNGLPGCTSQVIPQGGDYDTETIYLEQGQASLHVFGMNESGTPVTTPEDANVTMVFACQDPKHGMVNAKAADYALLARVLALLEPLGVSALTDGWKAHF